jgi:hypothetical protein
VKIARGEESHGGVPGGTSLYVGMLGVGYVNVPNKILKRETHDNCLSVLFVVSTPEMNTTAENWDDWMKLCRCDMNSTLRLWGGGC